MPTNTTRNTARAAANVVNDELAKVNTNIANEVAQSMGAENAQDFIIKTNADIKSKSVVNQRNGAKLAAEFTSELLLLCLKQEIQTPLIAEYLDSFANAFDDGYITEGNGKEYVIDLLTGSETFEITQFNPTTITSPTVYAKYIAMYEKDAQGNTVPTPQSYKFKKTLTLQEHIWMPYFTAGDLRSFIENIISKMVKSFIIYKYDKVCKLLVSLPISKTINGTATDLFEALSLEILPTVTDMTYLNQSYSIDNVNHPFVSNLDYSSMFMIVPKKVKNGLMHGVQSQLFNSHLMNIENGIPSENVKVLGDVINYPTDDSNKKITVSDGTSYLPDDTILVFDRDAIRHLQQIDFSGKQSYNNNLTIQVTTHIWGVIDYLPWRKAFKYVNANINVLPGQKTPTA